MTDTESYFTNDEQVIADAIKERYSEEQLCAFFLTKTIHSQYQLDDAQIENWYEDIFDNRPESTDTMRRELVLVYAKMLMEENLYDNHLFYWVKKYQALLMPEMDIFFNIEPGETQD
jgi:hypothetical protein